MDSLRLPPLRFSQPDSTHSLKCVLPPITSPLRPASISTSWQTSPPLPSPPTPAHYHSTDISTRTHPIADLKPSPPFTVTPSTIRPLPSSAMPPPARPQTHPYPPNPPPSPSPSPFPSHPQIYPHNSSAVYRIPNAACQSGNVQPSSPWQHRTVQSRAVSQLPSAAYPDRPSPAAAYNRFSTAARTNYTAPESQLVQHFRPMTATTDYFFTPHAAPTSTANAKKYTLQTIVDMRSPLKRTMNTARGMRDMYVCPYPNCSRVSTEQSNMKAHMRMHTGEKPYVCRHADCLKAFRWKSSLTYHEKALHARAKPFKCTPCRRSFVEKRKLKMHYDLCPMVKRREGEVGEGGDEEER